MFIEIWDWDRTSRNDFMGALRFQNIAPFYLFSQHFASFGVSELRKAEGARGWFKLLTQGEGEYYNVPVIAEEENVKAHIRKLKKTTEIQPKISRQDPLVPHNMKGKDVITAQDFNFLMLLGRGSFGKVRK